MSHFLPHFLPKPIDISNGKVYNCQTMSKDRQVAFRISAQQYAEIVRQAESRSMKLSQFLRDELLSNRPLGWRNILSDLRRNWRFYIGL